MIWVCLLSRCDDTEALQGWGGAMWLLAFLLQAIKVSPDLEMQTRVLKVLSGFWMLRGLNYLTSFIRGGYSVMQMAMIVAFYTTTIAASVLPLMGQQRVILDVGEIKSTATSSKAPVRMAA